MAIIKNIKVGDITYNIEVSYVDLADSGATQTSTSGTITNEQLTILQASKQNCIIFDNQIYRLQDNEHNSGILTYTYVGYDTEMVSKTITITISTLAWTLSTLEIESGGTEVVANNGETTSATLNTLKVGDTNYAVPQGGGGGGGETETIFEVTLTGVTLNTTTFNVDIPTQNVTITEEQLGTLISNKNVVIKANSDIGMPIFLKPFNTQVEDFYYSVWYGFMQIIESGIRGYNIGLKCVLDVGSSGYSLLFESVGLINEGSSSGDRIQEVSEITSLEEQTITITPTRAIQLMKAEVLIVQNIYIPCIRKIEIPSQNATSKVYLITDITNTEISKWSVQIISNFANNIFSIEVDKITITLPTT